MFTAIAVDPPVEVSQFCRGLTWWPAVGAVLGGAPVLMLVGAGAGSGAALTAAVWALGTSAALAALLKRDRAET